MCHSWPHTCGSDGYEEHLSRKEQLGRGDKDPTTSVHHTQGQPGSDQHCAALNKHRGSSSSKAMDELVPSCLTRGGKEAGGGHGQDVDHPGEKQWTEQPDGASKEKRQEYMVLY